MFRNQNVLEKAYGYGTNLGRKGSASCTDAFRWYQSLEWYGVHYTVKHARALVNRCNKNHINEIEGFWSYAIHILSQYRWVSKYHDLYVRN